MWANTCRQPPSILGGRTLLRGYLKVGQGDPAPSTARWFHTILRKFRGIATFCRDMAIKKPLPPTKINVTEFSFNK
ncbi:hypothetical protein NDI44_16255 [Trichocoleus sp. DQ-A3]